MTDQSEPPMEYTDEERLAAGALADLQVQLRGMGAAEGFVIALLALEIDREFWTNLIDRWLALPDVPDDRLRNCAEQFSEASHRSWDEAVKRVPTQIRNGRTPEEQRGD